MPDTPKESELRQAIVLFADISSFTAMSEKMLPEEYLEKARTMFVEMDLQWDLEQLEKVEQVSG
jgi:class 3 adenylate cyclase